LILIVDDDDSLRIALLSLVRSLGYSGLSFDSAEALLASGAVADSACIVTDIQMPGMTGIELEAHLRQAGYETPVVLMTARTDPEILRAGRDSGALCLLKKPLDVNALIQCLEQAAS
jgi:FixJ family two-component response regulator